ncbi:hypothetical protein PTSG_11809 [Salpingoeca rosetta]|uniref:Uncharacterized protein n=1 Tax=Salpingoeca rosetta (strain ATCC 50818 / BSB-021) TaxID=946362 RepID=F2TZF3_SALR5|nr:uncharacterized protein PTSG_11809 [Salpingoeca rosetta]EGD78977.1 hypothetical protein PTSG_11809 [Salpingoeca rosetta]|eukprot:XP_004997933.1 hypothetical protein PTSG_11809 [Salpingoeca rosetta]
MPQTYEFDTEPYLIDEERQRQLKELQLERERRRKRRRCGLFFCVGIIAVAAICAVPIIYVSRPPAKENDNDASQDSTSNTDTEAAIQTEAGCTQTCEEHIHECVGMSVGGVSLDDFVSCLTRDEHHTTVALLSLGACMSSCEDGPCGSVTGPVEELHKLQCWERCAFAAADVNCDWVRNVFNIHCTRWKGCGIHDNVQQHKQLQYLHKHKHQYHKHAHCDSNANKEGDDQ